MAYYLSQSGHDTVVLEKRDIGMGSSAASTGLLQYEVDVELHDLIEKVGETNAVRSYRLGLEAIQVLHELLSKLGDACDFEFQNSLYLASRKSHVAKLRREYACRKRFGFDVDYLEEADIRRCFPFTAPAAILAGGDAQLDPYRATHVLMRAAQANGARVYDRSTVASIRRSKSKVALRTDEGHEVKAGRLIIAAGYEAQRYFKKTVGKLHSTFAFISEPVASFADHADDRPAAQHAEHISCAGHRRDRRGERTIKETERDFLLIEIRKGADDPGKNQKKKKA